jgi:hypothetical protein
MLPSGQIDLSKGEGHITIRTPKVSRKKKSVYYNRVAKLGAFSTPKLGAGIAVGTDLAPKCQ